MRGLARTALLAAVLASGCSGANAGGAAAAAVELVVGGPGLDPGHFRLPRALAIDPEGRVFVADRSGRVQLFSSDGELLHFWRMPETKNGQSVGMAIESARSLLVCDTHYQRVFRYDTRAIFAADQAELAHERILSTAPCAQIGGVLGEGPGEFTWARDVEVDSTGALYIGDSGGSQDRIEKFAPNGTFLFEWGRRGTGDGEFDLPAGMDIERRGDEEFLLVADCNNHRVQRFTLDGHFVSAFGKLGTGPGELRYPRSVAVAPDASIWVCEWGNNRVQRFTTEGKPLGTWGAAGRGPGEFLTPWDVAVDAEGRIWVADYGNHRVQVLRGPGSLASAAGRKGLGPVPASGERR